MNILIKIIVKENFVSRNVSITGSIGKSLHATQIERKSYLYCIMERIRYVASHIIQSIKVCSKRQK